MESQQIPQTQNCSIDQWGQFNNTSKMGFNTILKLGLKLGSKKLACDESYPGLIRTILVIFFVDVGSQLVNVKQNYF